MITTINTLNGENDMITTINTEREQARQKGLERNWAIPVESGAVLHFGNTMNEWKDFWHSAKVRADVQTNVEYPIVRSRGTILMVTDVGGRDNIDIQDDFDGTAKDMIRFRDALLKEMQDDPAKFDGEVQIWLDCGFDLCSSIQMGDNYDYVPCVEYVDADRPVWDSTNGWAHKKEVK